MSTSGPIVDARGINTNKIPAMKEAIDEWANAIEAAKITVSAKNITLAIKGTNQCAEIKKLCQACDSYANTLTSKLRAYKNRLDQVKMVYEKNDLNSTAISDITSSIKKLKS